MKLFIYILTSVSKLYTGHIIMASFMSRGNQYIHLVKVLYCKLQTISKKLTHSLTWGSGFEPQRWKASVTTGPLWPPVDETKKAFGEYKPSPRPPRWLMPAITTIFFPRSNKLFLLPLTKFPENLSNVFANCLVKTVRQQMHAVS